jgi:hypothetical protein
MHAPLWVAGALTPPLPSPLVSGEDANTCAAASLRRRGSHRRRMASSAPRAQSAHACAAHALAARSRPDPPCSAGHSARLGAPAMIVLRAPSQTSPHSAERGPRRGSQQQSRRSGKHAAACPPPALAALRASFLDLQLAVEAGRGAEWASLDSSGVPLADPLDLPSLSLRCAPAAPRGACA